MAKDLNKVRRYELKYTIDRATANAIRDYIQPIFSLDKHADPDILGYTVNNLYFDSPDLVSYYDVKFRRYTRFKLRARYYGSRPGDDLWLEIKNKQGSIIWKKRRRIDLSTWPDILDRLPAVTSAPHEQKTFEELYNALNARPVMHARYFREPWVSDIDEYGRITFDGRLRYRLAHGDYDVACNELDMKYYDDPITMNTPDSPLILEIKVEQNVPFWAFDVIQRFGLELRGTSKYCYVIDQIQEERGSALRRSLL